MEINLACQTDIIGTFCDVFLGVDPDYSALIPSCVCLWTSYRTVCGAFLFDL